MSFEIAAVSAALGPSAGVAVARGDARAERPRRGGPRDAADDPASALDGNPLRQLGVIGPGAVLDSAFALLRFRFGRLLALTAVASMIKRRLARRAGRG